VSELFGASTLGATFSGSLRLQSQTPFFLLGLRFAGIEFSTLAAGGERRWECNSIELDNAASICPWWRLGFCNRAR
jgi:hypothetical protein